MVAFSVVERVGHTALDLGEQVLRMAGPRVVEATERFDLAIDRRLRRIASLLRAGRVHAERLASDLLADSRSKPNHPVDVPVGKEEPNLAIRITDEPPGSVGIDDLLDWPDRGAEDDDARYGLPVLELFGLAEPQLDYSGVGWRDTGSAQETMPRHNGLATRPRPADFWERLPHLADFTQENEVEVDTGSLIQRLWDFSIEEETDVDPEWQPEAFSAKASSRRTFRWSVLLLALLLAAGALALLLLATSIPESRASELASRYTDSLRQMQSTLPESRQAADLVTDANLSNEGLSAVAAPLARLEARALELSQVANAPLPQPPPLASHEPIEALRPSRDRLQQAAQIALDTQTRLGAVLDYRLLMGHAFDLPALPLTATSEEIADLNMQLSVTLADTIEAIAQLPSDSALDPHRQELDDLTGRLEEFQVAYLDALRQGDVEASDGQVEGIRSAIAETEESLQPALQEVNDWADARFGEIGDLLDQAAALLGSDQLPG